MRALLVVVLGFVSLSLAAQQIPADLFHELQWRGIGPYRGGRTKALSGVPSQPNVFYIGVCDGGVWKTDDYGRTWKPIFDHEPTGSIGAVAVAPSDPNVVYAGSGEGLHRPDLSVGDGMYKSTDAGKTWMHLGLRNAQQIANIAVDPRDPNRVLAAVAGHPYGPNSERGIFLSVDGGQSWDKVLYKDENTGGSDVLFDPTNPEIAYASLWEAREGPWENGAWNGTGAGIYKSTDGGKTWHELTSGLPNGMVQANLAIAPSDPNRLLATVALMNGIKLYGSNDGGANWSIVTNDPRPLVRIGGGGELPVPRIDPENPEIIYIASIVTWKSTDGGKTWTGFRGAPGGDDYQNVWINPNNPEIIALASDQGAIVTVNGGQSWSSWYNQNTAQLYHVSADNSFPYRVCSGQQESGSVCIRSRGNDGEITIRDWHPVAAEEYGYVAPDPLDPDIVYGGKLTRYDRRTGQAQDIAPKLLRGPDYRVVRTEPIVFSPRDPHVLYFASNVLWKTTTGGKQWQQISPDLTRKSYAIPATIGKYSSEKSAQPTQRGVIYTVAPSPLDVNRIWAGTDDGLIQLTTDGGAHWTDVTPKALVPWAKVSIIDASHFDPQTAYAAINTIRLDDLRPHLYRTHDGGKTWTEIDNGIPANENTNAIREDPKRKGLLYASTEAAVYVSFDDGDHWQSLRLNMPASSVRDIIVKDDDLVAATHGRGFWILDDITPLRQVNGTTLSGDHLFKPEDAVRVRWNMNTDTPLPPDFPAGPNPPDGAVLNYYLKSAASGPVTIEIKDASGNIVRRYSSAEPPAKPETLTIPAYWVRPPKVVETSAGLHRFLWDMHLQPIPGIPAEYPIAAIPHNTAPATTSPWAMPGNYTVVLTVAGKSYSQPLKVTMDPRVKTPLAGLQEQYRLSKQVYDDAMKLSDGMNKATELRSQLKARKEHAQGAAAEAITAFEKKLDEVAGEAGRRRGPGGAAGESLGSVRGQLMMLMGVLQDADVAPTTQTVAAIAEVQKKVPGALQNWQTFERQEIPTFNQQLKSAGLEEVKLQ
ncbi:MAG: glycoside hydrolase [Terriglobia bacterium]|nr:glycoside hydrolase [Terriglobia bacterium]